MRKTTYILAGGNDRHYADFGRRLFSEITKHTEDLKILSCFFSQPPETWSEKAKDWEKWFTDNFDQQFTYNYAKPETFLDQVDAATIVYFHGGNTQLLLDTLPSTDELKEHFAGKVIIGSSAGSNMLSRYFWSSTRGTFGEGRGIIDKSVMVHYGAANVGGNNRTPEDWRHEEEKFTEMCGQTAIHLPEGEFVIIEH